MAGALPDVSAIDTATGTTGVVLGVVRDHPSLLAFPAVAVVSSTLAFLPLLWGVTRAVEAVVGALQTSFGFHPVPVTLVLAYPAAAAFIAGLTVVVATCNVGIAAAMARLVRGESPSVPGGFAAGLRALPHVLVYAALVGVVGAVAAFNRYRSTRQGRRRRFTRLFGTSYTALTYLVGPAVVVDGASPRGMFRRSEAAMTAAFGEDPMVSMGILRGVATLFAVPFLLSQVALIGHMVLGSLGPGTAELPGWTDEPVVLAAIAGSLWVGIVLGSGLAAVAKTPLYVAIREDRERVPLLGLGREAMVWDAAGEDE